MKLMTCHIFPEISEIENRNSTRIIIDRTHLPAINLARQEFQKCRFARQSENIFNP
jgi:hypothetical protein